MAKNIEFREKYADQLENKNLDIWLRSVLSENELDNLYNMKDIESLFQGLNKLVEEIYGTENIVSAYMERQKTSGELEYLKTEQKICIIIQYAFNEYIRLENLHNTYISFLWETLHIIMLNTRIKREDRKVARLEKDNKYYIDGIAVSNENISLQSIEYILETPFHWLYEARLQDNAIIRHLIECGSRKNHTLEILLGELVKFEVDLQEFECYMIEDRTNVYSAWKVYSIMETFLELDLDDKIYNLVMNLAYEIGQIHNLEVRLQVLYRMTDIRNIIMWDEEYSIVDGLKRMLEEIKKGKQLFNKNYDKLLYILLFVYQREENWKKLLESVKGYKLHYFSQLRNKVIRLKDNMYTPPSSYHQIKFERLWESDNKSKRYRWFSNIWLNLKKGYFGK